MIVTVRSRNMYLSVHNLYNERCAFTGCISFIMYSSQDPNRKQRIQCRAQHFENEENLFSLPWIKPQFLGCEPRKVVPKLTGIMQLLYVEEYFQYVVYHRYTASEMQSQVRRDRFRPLVKKKQFISGPPSRAKRLSIYSLNRKDWV